MLTKVLNETWKIRLLRRARECDVVASPKAIHRIDCEGRISANVKRLSLEGH
jgi:hypothetical protein